MYIHNFRLGFATNSSSTHSIIILDSIKSIDSIKDDYSNSEFGWEFFTVKSKDAIVNYLETSLLQCFRNIYGIDVGNILAESLCKSIEDPENAFVDHQSELTFPCSVYSVYNNKPELDLEFYKDFKKYLLSNNTLILGGNDNDEQSHPLANLGKDYNVIQVEEDSVLWVSRYDETYDFYTLFNIHNGSKSRITFHDKPIVRTEYPELIDIKITDYCESGCTFCYQGSTTEGKHADMKIIKDILYTCSAVGVLEIAYGGGEPMTHPSFLDILEVTSNYKITPTFTTKQTKWLEDSLYTYKIMQFAKAFAYSPSSLIDLKLFIDLLQDRLDDKTIKKNQTVIHLVLGTLNKDTFKKMLRLAFNNSIKVTILGFKTTGFGETYKQQDSSWWLEAYKELIEEDSSNKWKSLAIDTVVVQQYKTELDKANINPTLYYATEGSFSCYIDAVNRKIGPSSFCNESEYIEIPKGYRDDIDFRSGNFKTIFSQLYK